MPSTQSTSKKTEPTTRQEDANAKRHPFGIQSVSITDFDIDPDTLFPELTGGRLHEIAPPLRTRFEEKHGK